MKLTIYIDGACRFNPGPAGIGVVVIGDEGKIVASISEFIGHGTNNIAEWRAYLRALEEAKRLGAGEIAVFTDSQLLACQINGQYKIRNQNLFALAAQARQMAVGFRKITVTSIPRERNKAADSLAKRAVAAHPA